jgi:epoxyqueuosine reductase
MAITSKFIKQTAFSLSADLCGIASVDRFVDAPKGAHPRDVLPESKSVIVIAKRFLTGTTKCSSSIPYTIIRNQLSFMIDKITLELSYILESKGAISVPTGAIEPCNWDQENKRIRGLISLKHSAELAGLGKIGKNTLLVNEKYGNMIWLGAVITDLELKPDKIADYNVCPDNCNLCIKSCPVGALGNPKMNQQECRKYAFGEENGGEWRIKCYKCRAICPNTNSIKKIRKASNRQGLN